MTRDTSLPETARPIHQDPVIGRIPAPRREEQKLANPGAFGLSAFAFTSFVMAMFNLSAGGVSVPNIIIGPALGYGGLGQLLAGMWFMAMGNTLGATIFGSYGCFWISFAIILTPGFGIEAAYPNAAEYYHGIGFFMLA